MPDLDPAVKSFLSERARRAALARNETAEQRKARTAAATAARKSARQRIDELTAVVTTLQAEVADLRERVAA